MTRDTSDLESDLKGIIRELWPHRPAEQTTFPDPVLALGVLLRREIALARKTTVFPAGYADGLDVQPTARSRGRRGSVE